jgi:hypothetical protein
MQMATTDYQAVTNSYMINDVACRVHVAYIQGAMETSLPRRAEDYAADSSPSQARQKAAAPPKRDRRRTLTRIDKRGRVGKRVARLVELFEAAFPAEALTPLKREQIASAAGLQALAEEARGKWMRGESGDSLDEIMRAERVAMSKVRGLGIGDEKPRAPSLLARLAAGAR